MKTVSFSIQGTTALLMHRFGEQAEVQKSTRKVLVADEDPRDAAERAAYRDPDGFLYLPSSAIARMLREAGGGHKQRGSRKSLKYVVPAAVRVLSDTLPLVNGDGKSRATHFEVDSRPVVIPATKGRIMRHRPRLNEWSSTFDLVINDEVLGVETVQQLMTEGGMQIGLGDYRPEKGGPFGTFRVMGVVEQK